MNVPDYAGGSRRRELLQRSGVAEASSIALFCGLLKVF